MPAALAVVAAALLLFLGTGRAELWPLAWIAVAPVLHVAYRPGRARRAFAIAAIAWLLGSVDLALMYAGKLPPAVIVPFLVAGALLFGLVVLASRALARRLPPMAALFAYPAVLAGYELALAALSPHGTAASLAYSQVACLPLLQAVSVSGFAGITFLVALPASALALWRRDDWRTWWAAGVAATIFVAALGLGEWRLRAPVGPATSIALVGWDGTEATFETTAPAVADEATRLFTAAIDRAAADGARWVVLPEKLVALRPAWADATRATLAAAAQRNGVGVVAGLNELPASGDPRNLAVVFAADGTQVAEYEKRHLLPGPETGYRAGATAATIGEGLGVAICKDLDFVDVGRDSALAGVRTLLVPAWDFDSDARFHARIAIARGVESGFAVARSAARGLLTASDGYGRIVGEAHSGAREPAVLVVSLPAGPGPTFFARHPRLPALLIGTLLALLLALALRRRPAAPQT